MGQKDPYAQFRFPKLDPPLTKAGKLEISKLESLEYLVNLMAGKLQPDLKKVWDQLAGRDITKNEISKSGMQLTGYDIKNECAKYKKQNDKVNYVNSLTKISAWESQINNQINQVNFIRPTTGPLSEILKECGDKKQQFHDCLYKKYYKDKADFSILLDDIQKNMIQKKSRKIVNRFKRLIECENPKLYKVNYFMRFLARTIQHGKKVYNTIKIQSLYTEESCCDCPQVFITLGTTKNLYIALLDTGAQASLIGYSCLKDFGYTDRDIKKTGASLNIESTTGLVKDAILGTITINIYIMLRRSTENARNFGRTKVTFLVASPEVNLNRIILGTPWMRSSHTIIDLAKDQVKARLHCNSTERECKLQLKIGTNLQLESEQEINQETNMAKFHMNAFFLQSNVSFKVHQKNEVVLPDIINMKNAIEITIEDGFPRILNNNGLEIPVRTKTVFQKLTINLTLMSEPTCEEPTCKEVQPSLQEIQTTPTENKSVNIPLECLRDAANLISLPLRTREALTHGIDNTVNIDAASLPETTICNKCHVYNNNCACKKRCDICQEWFSIVTDCKCTNDYIASLKTRITSDMSDEKDLLEESNSVS